MLEVYVVYVVSVNKIKNLLCYSGDVWFSKYVLIFNLPMSGSNRRRRTMLTILLGGEGVVKSPGWPLDGWSHDPRVILGVTWQRPQSVRGDVSWNSDVCTTTAHRRKHTQSDIQETLCACVCGIHTVEVRTTEIEYSVVCDEASAFVLGDLLPHQLCLIMSRSVFHNNHRTFWRNCNHNSHIM